MKDNGNRGQKNFGVVKESIPRAMNVITRKLARAKACLCYKTNFLPCNFILPLLLFLTFILWTNTPEGMLKSKLESWMQPQPLAMETENEKESEELGEEEEEAWLVETTQVRLWIGRKRLIG